MSDDQFTKLFKHMNARFDELDAQCGNRYAELKNTLDRVYDLLDNHIKQREADEQERLALVHQLNRHSGWIKQLATHTSANSFPIHRILKKMLHYPKRKHEELR